MIRWLIIVIDRQLAKLTDIINDVLILRILANVIYYSCLGIYKSKIFNYVVKPVIKFLFKCIKIIYNYFKLSIKWLYMFLRQQYLKFRKTILYYYIRFYVQQLFKFITLFVYFPIALALVLYTGVDQGLRFCWFLFIWHPYIYLNTNYQVKAKAIALFWYSWAKLKQFVRLLRFIYKIFKLIYVFIFYRFFVVLYVEIPWRPRNLILKKTYGRILRWLELFFDLLNDFVLFFWYIFRILKCEYLKFFRNNKRNFILFLRKKRLGKWWRRYMFIKHYLRFILFFFFFWYIFYFIYINADEIGIWWSPWSICSFSLFVTMFCFYYWYLLTKNWGRKPIRGKRSVRMRRVGRYLKEHKTFFWSVALMTWLEGQYADPETWGIPPTKILKILLSFWF